MVTNKVRWNYGLAKSKLRESNSQPFVTGLLPPVSFARLLVYSPRAQENLINEVLMRQP